MQTLYDVLGVPVSASQADVQNAYRRLLLRFHPERCYHDNDSAIYNPTAELDAARLQVLEKAHEILSNPKKRRLYDAYLTHKLRSHAVLYQSSYPQQWYARAAVVGAAGPSDDVLGSMMTDFHAPSLAPPSAGSKLYLSTYTASSQPSPVAVGANTAPAAVEAQTKPQTQHDQQQQQQQPAAPMTETLNTPMHAMADMTAADMPVVYAAAISLQRQPDGTVSVRTYKSGPRQLKTGQSEASSMSANSTAAAPATSATAAGAEATSKTTEVLPRRVRVMEQQLPYKGIPAGGEGVADAFGNVMSSLTNSVLSLMSTVPEA